MTLWIDNKSEQGEGASFVSLNPATGETLWEGHGASAAQVVHAVTRARVAFEHWRNTGFSAREKILLNFAEGIKQHASTLASVIAQETGKPFWEAKTEVAAMAAKIPISIRAYHDRTGERSSEQGIVQTGLRHRPLGVMAVFGPYNFPAHLPNGHIVPALLAGNTVVFKPSPLTPLTAEITMQIWHDAGLPKGVINLVQGGKETGEALAGADIDGILFTGSATTGKILHQQFAGKPEKMLALEMGGNNPLIVSTQHGNQDSAIYHIILSAFISAGQRCTCARRLFVPKGKQGDELIAQLVKVAAALEINEPFAEPTPFMGALISTDAANNMMATQARLQHLGGKLLLSGTILRHALVSPSIIDVTDVSPLPDEEYFAPLLQIIRYSEFADAVRLANQTKFGLSAGLLSTDDSEWQYFLANSRAGIINRNRPLTGASSDAPFGGTGESGNLRPSAYYAADYCAYPVASMEAATPDLPLELVAGINLHP